MEQQSAGILHYCVKDTHTVQQCKIRSGSLILHITFVINWKPGGVYEYLTHPQS